MTREKWKELTPAQQNATVSELCGLSRACCDDYLNDLNAMAWG